MGVERCVTLQKKRGTINVERLTPCGMRAPHGLLSPLSSPPHNLITLISMQNKSPIWKQILQIIITVLTAIATTFGVQSCL